MPRAKKETPKTKSNDSATVELLVNPTTKKSAKGTATKNQEDTEKNIEVEQDVNMGTASADVQTQTDDFTGMDIAPETETAVNATIISSLNDENKSNDIYSETVTEAKTEETTETSPILADAIIKVEESVEIAIGEKIDLPQLGDKIPPKSEIILEVALTEFHPPELHPFQVNHDEAMDRLVESIKEYGVHEPCVARPKIDKNGNFDGYELLVGNRRKMACELAGLSTLPTIIRELDDDTAIITMVDSNLEQREKILYSEKAWAYKIKMEALNHQGIKSKNSKTSAETITEQTGDSRNHIFRLIRLTELIVDLLDKVDTEQLAFHAAVELSYLSSSEQSMVASAMEEHDMKPSVSQAVNLKNLKQSGELTKELIYSILTEEKPKSSSDEVKVQPYRKFFPADYTPKQITKVITDLLKTWQKENLLTSSATNEINPTEQDSHNKGGAVSA